MNFSIGQRFSSVYPPEAAVWCSENCAMIVVEGNEYVIKKIPALTPEQQAEMRRQEILMKLDSIDRASSRSLRAILAAQVAGHEPDAADTAMLRQHENEVQALRAALAGLGPAEPAE